MTPRQYGPLIGIAIAVAMGAMLAGPVAAQDVVADWDLREDPQQQLTLATLDFGANQIALRCRAGVLELMLTGVPVTDAGSRLVRVTAGAIQDEPQRWNAWPGRPIASPPEPGRMARELRAGGELEVVLETTGTGERPRRYRLPVPASAAAVDRVLAACSVPLVDDWDLRPRVGPDVIWARQPTPEYPELAASRGFESGEARIGCLVGAEGGLDQCRLLFETPLNVGFGRNALRSLDRARFGNPADDATVIGKVVTFTIRFRVS